MEAMKRTQRTGNSQSIARLIAREARSGNKLKKRLTPYQKALVADGHCMADDDGDCSWHTWDGCPQVRDGEPARSGRHCPRDTATRLKYDDK